MAFSNSQIADNGAKLVSSLQTDTPVDIGKYVLQVCLTLVHRLSATKARKLSRYEVMGFNNKKNVTLEMETCVEMFEIGKFRCLSNRAIIQIVFIIPVTFRPSSGIGENCLLFLVQSLGRVV